MPLFLFCLLMLIASVGVQPLQPFAGMAQSQCSSFFEQGAFASWRSAMLCGTSLSPTEMQQGLRKLGLIHFMVVSGSHLIFLESLLTPFLFFLPSKKRHFPLTVILFVYSLMVGLQAPVVRALAQKNFFSSPSARLLISGIFSFAFFREFSLSLCLSWAAALLVSWPASKKKHPCLTAFFILAGLYPLILPLGAPGSLSSLFQPLFSLVFGFFLFPGSLLGLLPGGVEISDLIWKVFFKLMALIQAVPLEVNQLSLPGFPHFLYVLTLQYFYWRSEVSVTRKSLWQNS